MRQQLSIKKSENLIEIFIFNWRKIFKLRLFFVCLLLIYISLAEFKGNSLIKNFRAHVKDWFYSFDVVYKLNNKFKLQKIDNKNNAQLSNILLLEQYKAENDRLKQLLNFIKNNNIDHTNISTTNAILNFKNNDIYLFVDENNGLKSDQIIINEFGLVGKVAEIKNKIAKGILTTHERFRISALSSVTRYQFIASGTGKDILDAIYLPENTALKEGELIFANLPNSNRQMILGHATKNNKIKPIAQKERTNFISIIN